MSCMLHAKHTPVRRSMHIGQPADRNANNMVTSNRDLVNSGLLSFRIRLLCYHPLSISPFPFLERGRVRAPAQHSTASTTCTALATTFRNCHISLNDPVSQISAGTLVGLGEVAYCSHGGWSAMVAYFHQNDGLPRGWRDAFHRYPTRCFSV
jgi:hypothetical protein